MTRTPLITNTGISSAGMLISASLQQQISHATTTLATPVATTRRIAFISTVPRVGTSTIMKRVTEVLARHRSGRVLATTANMPQGHLDNFPKPSDEQLTPLPPQLQDSVRIHRNVWMADPDIDDRYFDIHAIDCGIPRNSTEAAAIADLVHAICIVAPFERSTAEPAAALAEALATSERATPVVIVFTNPTQHRTTWPQHVAAHLSVPCVLLDYDQGFSNRNLYPRAGTAHSITVLAAQLLTSTLAQSPAPQPSAPSNTAEASR